MSVSLDKYINELSLVANNLDVELKKEILKKKGVILGTVKLRFYQRGISGDGGSLGTYHPSTIKRKRAKGQIASHVTLRDTGDWYKDLFLTFEENTLLLDNDNWKNSLLVEKYGDAILDFTQQEEELIYSTIIDPFFIAIEKRFSQNIEPTTQ